MWEDKVKKKRAIIKYLCVNFEFDMSLVIMEAFIIQFLKFSFKAAS